MARAKRGGIRWCGCRCGSGCCGSRRMPTGWKRIWKALDWSRGHQGAAAQLDRPQHGRGSRLLTFRTPRRSLGRIRGVDSPNRRCRIVGKHRRCERLTVYTTRPDTLFGATYMVIAPEHPFVERLTKPEQAAAGGRTTAIKPPGRATWTAPSLPRRRPASSPAAMRSIR